MKAIDKSIAMVVHSFFLKKKRLFFLGLGLNILKCFEDFASNGLVSIECTFFFPVAQTNRKHKNALLN